MPFYPHENYPPYNKRITDGPGYVYRNGYAHATPYPPAKKGEITLNQGDFIWAGFIRWSSGVTQKHHYQTWLHGRTPGGTATIRMIRYKYWLVPAADEQYLRQPIAFGDLDMTNTTDAWLNFTCDPYPDRASYGSDEFASGESFGWTIGFVVTYGSVVLSTVEDGVCRVYENIDPDNLPSPLDRDDPTYNETEYSDGGRMLIDTYFVPRHTMENYADNKRFYSTNGLDEYHFTAIRFDSNSVIPTINNLPSTTIETYWKLQRI